MFQSLVGNDEYSKSKIGGASSTTSITQPQNGHLPTESRNGVGGGTLGRAASWALGFEKLLADSAGVATFKEFLKKEFSEENIIFWEECESLKKVADVNEVGIFITNQSHFHKKA